MGTEGVKKQGMLILIGGAEDKRDNKTVLRKMLEKTNATSIVIIPTASCDSRRVCASYTSAFESLGATKVESFDIRHANEADKDEYHQKLNDAELVYFTGGDQTRLIEVLNNSELLKKIKEAFLSGNLHIAGTSAGAAAAGHITIYDGDYQGFSKDAVASLPAFGFIDDLIVDTHFFSRERIPRLLQALISGQCTRGIGIDEDTAVIIYPDQHFEVFGSGMVTILNTDRTTESNYQQIADKEVYTANNLRIGFLAPGTIFSLKQWSVLKTSAEKNLRKILFDILPNY